MTPLELDLDELELDTGVALAREVDSLRVLAGVRVVVLHRCPQMLAHTLYKAGLLRDGRIVLASMREEEPYG